MVKRCQGRQCILNAHVEFPRGLGLAQPLGREAIAGERRQLGLGGQEISCPLVGLRHGTGLAPGYRSGLDELDQLQHVAAHPAAEAVPALLIEHDVE